MFLATITVFLVLLICLSAMIPQEKAVAFAGSDEYTPVITVENKRAYCGQTFAVDVVLSGNEGLLDLYLTLFYDKNVMQLTGLERGDALSGLTFTATNTDTEEGYATVPFNMLWDGTTVDRSNGTIVTLIFESYITTPAGDYPITLTYDVENTNKGYQDPIAVDVRNGTANLVTGDFWAAYYDWNGTELFRKEYRDGETPSYEGTTPARQADECYSYEFIGWKGIVSDEESTLKYEADYRFVPKKYQAFYYVDGIENDSFDGILTTDDFWTAEEVDYGAYLENEYPTKARYVFSGWYTDAECTVPFIETRMPARDISLYGFFVYDIRTTSIPKIQLRSTVDGDNVTVIADMVKNTGFNGMVLTLDYDKTALEFLGYEKKDAFSALQFDTTNTENGYDVDEFKFWYEHSENSYETGEFLKLKFRVRKESTAGVYETTFVLGNTDATYINGVNGIRYTKIEVIGAQVPVGKIYQWEKSAEDTAEITVEAAFGLPSDTVLKVSVVPEENHGIDAQTVEDVAGKDMELKAVYDLELKRVLGDVETTISPEGTLTVAIKLTADQQKCDKLEFYYVDEEGKMIEYDFERIGDTIRFETTKLGRWAIVGNKPLATGRLSDAAVTLITMPIMLAIVTMAYALILMGQRKNELLGKEKLDV